MALSNSAYQDANGIWVYEVNGSQVDETVYHQNSTTTEQLNAQMKNNGWSDAQIATYNAQDNEDPGLYDLVIDPGTGGPITKEELNSIEADAELDNAILDERQVAYDQAQKDAAIVNKENDWRVRLHLGSGANFLYRADDPGILAPLRETDGIIFPYTPQIQVQYSADYENYDLVHSNYNGYFYKGSKVQNIILTATFTANDVDEANYLLASMHFLRSCTKMFYGQEPNRGMPPPVVFLTGLGEFQFKNHPCAVTSIHYNLPNDVDYIPCGKADGIPVPPIPPVSETSTPQSRLKSAGMQKGGRIISDNASQRQEFMNPYTKATYVPTKIDINFTMIPIQTRDQVSQVFSLEKYASGELLTKGYW